MPRCPYAPHVLVITAEGRCRSCEGDVRVYAAFRWLPALLYNDALRLVELGQDEAASILLQRVTMLRRDFPEAEDLAHCIALRKRLRENADVSAADPAEVPAPESSRPPS